MRHSKDQMEHIKERILEKAAEAFVANGYAGVNLQDIADAAGISRGPLYYHFNNKEELFAATVRKLIKEQRENYERVLSMDAPILDILREEYTQCLSYSNTLLQTMAGQPELQNFPEYQEFSHWLYNRKKEVFIAAKEKGAFREDCDPNRLVTFLYVFYSGIIQMRQRRSAGFELTDSDMLDNSVDAFLNIVKALYLA